MKQAKNEKNRQIKVMFNTDYKGKVKPQYMGHFNKGFHPHTLTVRDFAANIYRGYAFTPLFEGRRKKANFTEAWHIALDFDTQDTNSALDTIAGNPLAFNHAAFGYTTPSHTEEKPKARLVFVFDKPITDLYQYEELYKALMWRFPHADRAAKDGLRLFYGSEKCTVWQNWSILPLAGVDELISQYREHLEAIKPPAPKATITITPRNADKRALKAIDTMLQNIENAPRGQQNQIVLKNAFAIGGYVAGGYLTQTEAENLVNSAIGRMDTDLPENHERTALHGLREGQSKPLTIEQTLNILDPATL